MPAGPTRQREQRWRWRTGIACASLQARAVRRRDPNQATFEQRNGVLEIQLAPLQALDFKFVIAGVDRQPCNHRIEVAMLGLEQGQLTHRDGRICGVHEHPLALAKSKPRLDAMHARPVSALRDATG